MAEYMHLIGTEQIQSAANTMRDAAHEMRRAANLINESVNKQERIMEDFINNLSEIMSPKYDKDGNRIY